MYEYAAYGVPGTCVTAKIAPGWEIPYAHCWVTLTATGIKRALPTDIVLGVAQRKGVAGETIPVMIDGIATLCMAQTCVPGDPVGVITGGDGYGSKVTTGAYQAIAMAPCTAASDHIPVQLCLNSTK